MSRAWRAGAGLLLLERAPAAVRAPALVAAVALAAAAGALLGRDASQLSGGPHTAWVGWLAAVFFAVAAVRIRRGPLEPSPGRTPVEELTASAIRRGLRREHLAVRVLLATVSVVALIDVSRALTLAVSAARSQTVAWTAVEAAGVVVAAVALGVWVRWFSADLQRLGVLHDA